MLTLDHVGQRLQGPIRGAHDRTLTPAVVKQRINRLLQHALLVADDHLGCVEVNQLLEAVVAIDDTTVQVVQVAGCEVAAIQQNQRTQVWGYDRNAIEYHPFGFVGRSAQTRIAQAFHHAQTLDQILQFLLTLGISTIHFIA